MSTTTQILDAASSIIKFLYRYHKEEDTRSSSGSITIRRHVELISELESAALHSPIFMLYIVVMHDIHVFNILDVLQDYPLALDTMCKYQDSDGENIIKKLKKSYSHSALKHKIPEQFSYLF